MKREPGFYWVRFRNPNHNGSDDWTVIRYHRILHWLINGQWMDVPNGYFLEIDERRITRET